VNRPIRPTATAAPFEDDDGVTKAKWQGIKNGRFGEANLRMCLSRLFGLFPILIDLLHDVSS
jgi:hypothetical protein